MKKIVLTLALAVFAFAANAQLVVSANIGGSMTSGTVNTYRHVTIVLDSTSNVDVPMEKYTNFTGGLKIGYKFGNAQAGIAASYNMYTIDNQKLDPTIIPIIGTYEGTNYGIAAVTSMGGMSTKGSSITVAPYFRYDVIKAGDVAIFAELDLFFSRSNSPTIHAWETNVNPIVNFSLELDSTFTRPMVSTTLGASVVPGLSWQLSKNCGIDLYLDFLSLAYSKTTTVRMDNAYQFRLINGVELQTNVVSTITTIEEQQVGGGLTGTPLLTELGRNNWVRVGFNFTF
ncbi:MAG: hypothetical protein IJK84_07040 [Bacteroidales bacterium]|nr:hypothetical protein [Bacteroidales bacterium]